MGAQPEQNSPTISKKEKNSFLKKIPYKNWKLWAVCSGVLLVLLMVSLITGGFRTTSTSNSSYEVIDLKGKTISEACEIAKSNGWIPYVTIWSSGNDDRQGDCYSNLEVQKFEYDSGYCWGASESTKTKKNVCITAYDNGYTGPDSNKDKQDSATDETNSSVDSSTTNSPSASSATNSPSASNAGSSPSSSSGSSSSSDGMCKSDYQKDLDAAKAAYEAAKSVYDTYKSLGVDASTLETYQSTLDLAKTSLDAAQKIYDTYCK